MRIDFNTYEHTIAPEFMGGAGEFERQLFVDERGKILTGRLKPGCTVGLHTHVNNAEVIYVLEGTGYAVVDGEREDLAPGVCTYCPRGSQHEIICEGPEDLFFFAVVPEYL